MTLGVLAAGGCNVILGFDAGEASPGPTGASTGGAATPTATPAGSGGGSTPAGGAGGQGAVGAGGQAGGGAGPCHPPGALDTFDGPGINGAMWGTWTDPPSVDVGIDSGILFVAPPDPAPAGDHYGGLYSLGWFDLTSCATWIELTRAFPASASGETYFHLRHDADDFASFRVSAGGIVFELEVATAIVATHSLSFDPAQHRWLQFREQAGTLYWETSPDGETWSEQLAHVAPAFVTQVEMNFGAGVWGPASGHGRAEFDNANVVVP